MIEKDIAKKQLSRITRMVKFPDTREGAQDMISALQIANSEDEAQECISHFLDMATSETRCPMPREIREWLYQRQEAQETASKTRTRNCSICGGTGQEIIERNGYTGARVCQCRRQESAA